MDVLPDDSCDRTGAHESHDDEALSFHLGEGAEEGNVQRPIPKGEVLALFLVRCWTLSVGRWTFFKSDELTLSR
jgi:hypothetical protein